MKMMEILENTYPGLWMNYSEDFNGSKYGIWICAEDGVVDRNGDELFDYYAMNHRKYMFGVVKHLSNWAQRAGWYFEWHDPGTIFMWKIHND